MKIPVASPWFERRTVGDGITLLWEPYVTPLLRCNIWYVRGRDRDLLIDSGLAVASLREAARDLFEHPLAAIATHAHMDHVGGMHEFETRYIHAAEAAALATAANHLPLDLAAYAAPARQWSAAIATTSRQAY